MQKKHFYLFRHGQSSFNALGKIQGQTNESVLTELGLSQAFHIGIRLKNTPLDVIISSPLERALQTAKEVLKTHPVPLLIDQRFTEVNVGEIEGLHYTSVQEKYGEKYDKWRSLDEKYLDLCFQNGETKREVRSRVFDALNEYAIKSPYQHIGISGHGILLSQVLLALGEKADDIKNAGIIHLTYETEWQFINQID